MYADWFLTFVYCDLHCKGEPTLKLNGPVLQRPARHTQSTPTHLETVGLCWIFAYGGKDIAVGWHQRAGARALIAATPL